MINKKVLLIILVIAFLIRSFYAVTEDNLLGSDSYYHYRIANYFSENSKLPETDDLYYGGREHTYLPLFHVLLGLLGKILPLIIVAKFFPAIVGALYILICYFIFKKKRDGWIFLFLLATFPVLIFKQASYLLADNLSLLFIALLILFYKKNNIKCFLLTMIAYSFTHLSVVFFSIIFFLISLFNKKGRFLAASLIPFLALLIFFPEQLLHHSQNIPPQLKNEIFKFYGLKFLILKELSIPIFIGLILFLWKRPRFDRNFLFLLLPLFLFPLKIITLDRSIAYSAIPLTYLAGIGLRSIKRYRLWVAIFIIIFSLFSAYLAINQLRWGVMDSYEKEALEYLSEDCNVVLTSNFGHWVTAYGCTVFLDDVYVKESEERYDILSKIYNLDDKALIMLEENNISHILIFEAAREKYPNFLEKAKKTEFLELEFDNEKVQIFSVG